MLQLADVMHRAKLFLSKKEMTREYTQVSLMLQNIRQYQEAYNKGEEISMDHFHTAIRELNECLQEKEHGNFRENLENRRGQTGRQPQQVIMEQQPKPRSVGAKMEKKETHPDESSKGTTGNKA